MKSSLLLIFIFYVFFGFSQVGIGTISPDTNAVLDINSNSKGVLFPRLTDAQRDAIANPSEGLFIYNLDNHRFEYFNGTEWLSLSTEPIVNKLFISEYAEPASGNNKYIEIYNPNNFSVSLSDYSLSLYSNGNLTGNIVNFTGTITANDVFVVYKNSATSAVTNEGDYSYSQLQFSGNDAVQLRYIGEIVDQVGIIGVDPGNAWDVAGTIDATKDHVLQRKATVTMGNINWISSAGTNATDSEWIVLPNADYSGLGSHP